MMTTTIEDNLFNIFPRQSINHNTNFRSSLTTPDLLNLPRKYNNSNNNYYYKARAFSDILQAQPTRISSSPEGLDLFQ